MSAFLSQDLTRPPGVIGDSMGHILQDKCTRCILVAGPFKQDPPWTDDNKVEAEALLELGEKVPNCPMPIFILTQHSNCHPHAQAH